MSGGKKSDAARSSSCVSEIAKLDGVEISSNNFAARSSHD
jgi:hypothetical protein